MKTINCNNGWYLGLGDLVCFAWLATGAKDAGEPVRLFATGWRAEVLRLLGVEPTDDPEGSIISRGGFEDTRAAGEEISYLEAMRREFGIKAEPLRPKVFIETSNTPHLDRKVLLFPQTHGPQRRWPISYWIDLAHLLQQRGLNPAVVLQERDARLESRVPFWITGLSHPDLFALTVGARLVISSDSGPAHVAGTIGVKTLVLSGPTGKPTYAHLPEVDVMHRESPECSGCHYRGAAYRPACETGCSELYALTPGRVAFVAVQLLGNHHPAAPTATPVTAPTRRKKK